MDAFIATGFIGKHAILGGNGTDRIWLYLLGNWIDHVPDTILSFFTCSQLMTYFTCRLCQGKAKVAYRSRGDPTLKERFRRDTGEGWDYFDITYRSRYEWAAVVGRMNKWIKHLSIVVFYFLFVSRLPCQASVLSTPRIKKDHSLKILLVVFLISALLVARLCCF